MMRVWVFVIMVCALAVSAQAASLGVSPSRLYVQDAIRGSHIERTLEISSSSLEESLRLKGGLSDSAIASWVSLPNISSLVLSPEEGRIAVKVVVDVPDTASNGFYSGRLLIQGEPVRSESANSVGIAAGVSVQLFVNVTGVQTVSYELKEAMIPDTEVGAPLLVKLDVENTGNVDALPQRVRLDIFDKAEVEKLDSLVIDSFNEAVPPFQRKTIVGRTDHSLAPETYWAKVSWITEEDVVEDKVVFRVFEKGSLKKKGVLRSLDVPSQVDVSNPVKITAVFDNTGSLDVVGVFKGEVSREGVLIDTLASEELLIVPGESAELVTYYTPSRGGLINISGHVVYEGKRTERLYSVISVIEPEKTALVASLFILPVLCAIALISILGEKRR